MSIKYTYESPHTQRIGAAGRPPKPAAERRFSTSFTITQDDLKYLHDLGSGNRSLGLMIAVRTLKTQQAASLAAIKAAAERRDQTKVSETAFD